MESKARKFLTDLIEAAAPTGFEASAVKVWCQYLKPHADEVFTDAYGNGFAVLNPEGDPTVILTGHADEIGLMVTHIDDEGFIWVGSLGGYDAKILPAMRVKIFTKKGIVPGVIGALPPHMQNTATGGTELKRYRLGQNVYIDIGARDKKDAERLVRVGDSMILDYGWIDMENDLFVARGLDNKIGIWAAAEGLRQASKHKQLNARVVAMATVQEEIGGYGAQMGSFRIDTESPEGATVALACDVSQSVDHPGTDKKKWGENKMGKGPVLAHGSACHPVVVKRLEQLAKRLRINVQHEAAPMWTGTDADSIFTTRAGIPTAVISLAQRYMHSPAEMVNLKDLEQIASLMSEFCISAKSKERFKAKV